ncbi:hypothetical protein FIBSPDRAFT_100197 [Athelia psychrophila]|uniref:Uncharacterized protein n=1 Tax=Athelia psychrophila TaxID=1759441 RepID=A0A167STL6_9AGAM|nr:hypothetical protein FIBSPDRAFT_100197 [Fibularhizoctonia sp. CBS 109695]
MAPTTSTGSIPSGSATLIGLAILENPCTLSDRPMTVHFDAQPILRPLTFNSFDCRSRALHGYQLVIQKISQGETKYNLIQ